MPVAAVPRYLGRDFEGASPGMRFGYLLDIWTTREDQEKEVRQEARKRSPQARELEGVLKTDGMDAAIAHLSRRRKSFPRLWAKNDFAAREIWKRLVRLSREDEKRLEALSVRQGGLVRACGHEALVLAARNVGPFVTGLGNEHPLENGFAFLWPHGLPYLPGSGVKGVVRRAAEELAGGLWGDARGWSLERRHAVRGLEGPLSDVDLLFGNEPPAGSSEHFRGCLTFWDVYPQVRGGQLHVEVMTPHQSHYYQKGEPPHDCGQPNPIKLLTLPPDSEFVFHVTCDHRRLAMLAEGLASSWKGLVEAALELAGEWVGFGAKTAIGYGHLRRDREAEQERARAEEAARDALRQAAMSAEERLLDEVRKLLERDRSEARRDPGGELNQRRLILLEEALEWKDPALRTRAAELLEDTARWIPWAKKRRDEVREQLRRLKGS